VVPATQEAAVGGSLEPRSSRPASAQQQKLPHITKQKSPGDVAQVLEHLPTKCKALSSNPHTAKKLKKKKRKEKKMWEWGVIVLWTNVTLIRNDIKKCDTTCAGDEFVKVTCFFIDYCWCDYA
jgi:hypothetical protein